MAGGRFKCEVCGGEGAHRYVVESTVECIPTRPWIVPERSEVKANMERDICDRCLRDTIDGEQEAALKRVESLH